MEFIIGENVVSKLRTLRTKLKVIEDKIPQIQNLKEVKADAYCNYERTMDELALAIGRIERQYSIYETDEATYAEYASNIMLEQPYPVLLSDVINMFDYILESWDFIFQNPLNRLDLVYNNIENALIWLLRESVRFNSEG